MRALLVEEVAALRPEPRPVDDAQEPAAAEGAEAPAGHAATADRHIAALAKARRRALGVVILDWVAIAVLFLTYREPHPFLSLGSDPRTIFTVGILAIAVHSGFRLAQLQGYRRIAAACEELAQRSGEL